MNKHEFAEIPPKTEEKNNPQSCLLVIEIERNLYVRKNPNETHKSYERIPN